MNWFGGRLEVWLKTNESTFTPDQVHSNVSLIKAQEIVDALPKGTVRETIYHPYAINLAPTS